MSRRAASARRKAPRPLTRSVPAPRTSAERSYGAQRVWLLARYGPVCAYCGVRTAATAITLDHVRPRRGQSAYDRPDNLVLACRSCNGAKADLPLLTWLMAKRIRAVFLAHYGEHLSSPLQDMARLVGSRSLLPPRDPVR